MLTTCIWVMEDESLCGELCEGRTQWCASHGRQLRKEAETSRKQSEKREALLKKAKNQKPKKAISRNPKDWSNTFLCSGGKRIKQSTIDSSYKKSKVDKYGGNGLRKCEGCGTTCNSNAHIISKARCKQIGKTELIWNPDNYFPACYGCNAAIENPKAKEEWMKLKNIEYCLSFIKLHDPELYTKFELAAIDQTKETI